ncbi:S1C family serine protease [Oceanobacillus bengalensis]|uniref:Serine protease n=1 Tax=Oceanobacillus bengalensis TaxID=1435466 RepID=A0A494Z8C1_9BACI|nr:serine protease [Oceanobacillus bengalensis]RKQ18766.1 serine protease [Oceanobacillus bengalensis]
MDNHEHKKRNIIDEDLFEEFDDEELYELVQEERRKALAKEKEEKDTPPKRPFPKWAFWLIAIAMFINVFALIPQTFSIPAIDFLITSAKLSINEDIRKYKEAVVVIESENSKGTGFAFTEDGFILTNYHVIEDKNSLAAAFSEEGLFEVEVIDTYPSIDLAVLKVDGENLPHLTLSEDPSIEEDDAIRFIGNPLRFNGIANEGNIIGYTALSDWEEEVVMIEAPVYRGNSGSPILNEDGEVIGVIFATINSDAHGKVGLFVPIDLFYNYHS